MRARALAVAVLLVPFLLAAILAACGPEAESPAETTAAGSSATTRVATLLPYVAEALDAAAAEGAPVEVVASVAPTLGGTLPEGRVDLGSPHSPSFETLAAARAGVVVGDRRFHAALEETLRRGADRVILVEADSVEDTFDGLTRVAAAAGAESAMGRLVADSRAELDSLGRRVRQASQESGRGPTTVLALFGAPGSYMAITDRTWLGDLLRELGFRNVAADLAGRESYPGYVELSEEVLATLVPDAVLLVTHGSPEAVEEDFRRRAEDGGAWAVLADKVRLLDADLFARNPGLGLPEAGRALVDLLMVESSEVPGGEG